MELKKLLNRWFVFTLFMLIITFIIASRNDKLFSESGFLINLLSTIVFFYLIGMSLKEKSMKYFSKKRLVALVSFYSLLFVFIYNLLYFWKTGDFYEFSAVDTFEYDGYAKKMINYGLYQGIVKYLNYGGAFDDIGAVFFTSLAYRFYESPIAYNLLNVIAGIVTATSIYRISLSIMNRKYAYISALAFGLSSFTLYLHSTGMKESMFTMWVVLYFKEFVIFSDTKKIKNIILAFLYLAITLLYRPAVTVMMAGAVLFSLVYGRKKGITYYIVLFALVVSAVYYSTKIEKIKERYYGGAEMVAYRAEQFSNIKASKFNYGVSFTSSSIGPLPTYHALIRRLQQSFYSVGLGFRVFISIFFWLGVYIAFKRRSVVVLALSSFAIFEMFSLSIILEAFELRLNSPHLPIVYIVAFYFLYIYEKNKNTNSKTLNRIINVMYIVNMSLIFLWNLRI